MDRPIRLKRQNTGDGIIEKRTIMTDHHQGAGVLGEFFFEHFQGLNIKIVGGFIQN